MSTEAMMEKESTELIDVVKAGYLHRCTMKAITKVWKKQWFILSNADKGGKVLTVYAGVTRRSVQAKISLENFISVRVDPHSKKKSTFVILTKNSKVYLKASNEDEMHEWIAKLYEVVETDESFHVSVPKQQNLKACEAVIQFKEENLLLTCPRTNDIISSFELTKIVVFGNIITSEQIFWFETCNRCCRRGRTIPGIFTFTKMCLVSDRIDRVLETMKNLLEQNHSIFVRVDTSHRLGDTYFPTHNCGVKCLASRSQVSIIAPSISQCILSAERGGRDSRKSSMNSFADTPHRLDTLKVSPVLATRRRSRTDSDIVMEQGQLRVKAPDTSPNYLKRYSGFRVRKMSEPAIHLTNMDPRKSPRVPSQRQLPPNFLLKPAVVGKSRIIERTSTSSAPPLPPRNEASKLEASEILRAGSSETAVTERGLAEKDYFKSQDGQIKDRDFGNFEGYESDAYYIDEASVKGPTVNVAKPLERKISSVAQPSENQRRTSQSSACLQTNGRKISTTNPPTDRRLSQVSKQQNGRKVSTSKQPNGALPLDSCKARRPGKSHSSSYINQLAVNLK
ncbi:uncharacterized protein [Ptychodera flava]|uniref:uncharacterized protein n=1 Tax=Ptychodera flava TaxID=63121 RepID=UPI00396A56E2